MLCCWASAGPCHFSPQLFWARVSWPRAISRFFSSRAPSLQKRASPSPSSLCSSPFSFPQFFDSEIALRVLFLANLALGIEVADSAALAAGCWIEHRVDERRLAGIHGRVDGPLQLIRGSRVDAYAAKSLDHLVVARAFNEDGRRGVLGSRGVDVGAAVDTVIVEDDDADRQPVAANGFHFHARESEGAVA